MELHKVRFVDLKHSSWDKEKSKPREGKYVFKEGKKLYIDYMDKARRPEWFLSWSRYDPHNKFRDLIRDKYSKGYVEVNVDEDDWVWPEPLVPDENGWYILPGGDVILMKRPLIDELRDRVAVKEQSEKAPAAAKAEFDAAMRKQGVEISEEVIRESFK